MADENTHQTTDAAPAAPAPTTAAQPEPAWLNGRLEQAKRSAEADLLRSLGVASADEVKAALAAKKAADEANKTSAEKAADLAARLEAANGKASALEAAVKERAGVELAALTDAQRAAVQAVAPEDAAAQLRAIDKLRPTWAAPAAPAAPKPDTAPSRTAPAGGDAGGQPDHLTTYRTMRDSNPFAAAQYRRQHAAAIAAAESSKT